VDFAPRLREALLAADFTADGCLELLGATAYAALSRAETVPALRATRGGGPLESLIRLFLLQRAVPAARLRGVLPVEEAVEHGWLAPAEALAEAPAQVPADTPDGGSEGGAALRATVDVRPYAGDGGADWWIVSDLGCAVGGANGVAGAQGAQRDQGGTGSAEGRARDRSGLVLGVGGASTTLAGLTVRRPVERALDLGSGCGVQALHASAHAGQVTATDVNPRALGFTRLTLALSGAPEPVLREGSLFEPVAGERFGLIVSNPPFVISPGSRFTYRDGGMAGDELCRALVERAAGHLDEGGYCQLLANWEHTGGPGADDWRERLAGWVPAGCDAWIVQREVQDTTQYAELWLRDGGDHLAGPEEYAARYDAWLDAFERRGVTGVGFGWITLRRTGADRPSVTVEEWPHPVEQPLGPAIEAHFERQDFLRARDDAALLATAFRLAEDVVQEQVGPPGAEDPEHVVLRSARGMRRATRADTVGAGFAGACDGTLPAGRILDAIAQLLGEDPVLLRDRTPESIRLLVEQGFLEPAG
jgi:methylase of polypeptide subunit release factors